MQRGRLALRARLDIWRKDIAADAESVEITPDHSREQRTALQGIAGVFFGTMMGMSQSEDNEEEEPGALQVPDEFRAALRKPEVSNGLINRRLPARESRDGNGADSACFPFPLPRSSIANKKRKSRQ